MGNSLSSGITREEIEELYLKDREGFYRLFRRLQLTQSQLASVDINYFIQFVMKEEGSDRYLRQTPVHVELQKHVEENDMSLIWGAVKVGKCVTYGTKFVLEDGRKVSAERLLSMHRAGLPLSVWTIDKSTWRKKLTRVVSVFNNGTQPTVRVTTVDGHSSVTTLNHPYLTNMPDGLDFVDAGELTSRDYVAVLDPTIEPPAVAGEMYLDEEAFYLGVIYSLHAAQQTPKAKEVRPASALGDRLTWRITTQKFLNLYEFVVEALTEAHTRYVKGGEWVEPTNGGVRITLSGLTAWLTKWRMSVRTEREGGTAYAYIDDHGVGELAVARGSHYTLLAGLVAPWLRDHAYLPIGQVQVPRKVGALVEEIAAAAGVSVRRLRSGNMAPKSAELRMSQDMDQLYFESWDALPLFRYLSKYDTFFEDCLKQFVDDMTSHQDVDVYANASEAAATRLHRELERQVAASGRLHRGTLMRCAWVPRKHGKTMRMVRVASVRRSPEPSPTIGVEVDGDHTHITDGLVTHNTQQITVARTLFHLGKNQNIRVLIVQSTGELAKDALHQIKQMIELSDRLHQVFPALQQGDRWAEKEIRVKRTAISLTPSVRAIGANTKIDGSRYDLVIIDDALSFDNTYTKTERDKLFKWIQTVPLSRLALGAKVVFIGNAFHCMLPNQLVRTNWGYVKAHLLTPDVMSVQVSRRNWEVLRPHNYHVRHAEKEQAVRISYHGVPWTTEVTANHKLMDELGDEVLAGNVKVGEYLSMWRSVDAQPHAMVDNFMDESAVIPDHVAHGIQLDYAEMLIPLNVEKVHGGCRLAQSNRYLHFDGGRVLYKVKAVEHFEYTGNVYDITTSTGWFATAPVIIHNSDDPMHRFEKLPNTSWKARRFPARDPVTKLSLMPYLWPQKALEEWERARSPSEVRRSLDCVPWSNDSSRFKLPMFDEALARGKNILVEDGQPVFFLTRYDLEEAQAEVERRRAAGEQLALPVGVFTGVDIGFGMTEDADFTALYTHVVFDNGATMVIDMEKGRFGTAEFMDKVVSKHLAYGSDVFVESVLAQKFMFNTLKDLYPGVPIFEWRTQGTGTVGNKWHATYGIAMVEDDYARGRPTLPCIATEPGSAVEYEVHPLVREYIDACLTYVPDKSIHTDDMLMASWIALAGARERGSPEYLAAVLDPNSDYFPVGVTQQDEEEVDEDERMAERLWEDLMPGQSPWGLDEEIK